MKLSEFSWSFSKFSFKPNLRLKILKKSWENLNWDVLLWRKNQGPSWVPHKDPKNLQWLHGEELAEDQHHQNRIGSPENSPWKLPRSFM